MKLYNQCYCNDTSWAPYQFPTKVKTDKYTKGYFKIRKRFLCLNTYTLSWSTIFLIHFTGGFLNLIFSTTFLPKIPLVIQTSHSCHHRNGVPSQRENPEITFFLHSMHDKIYGEFSLENTSEVTLL